MVASEGLEESPLAAAFNLSDLCVLCFMRTINSGSLESVNTRNWVLKSFRKCPLKYVHCEVFLNVVRQLLSFVKLPGV